MKLLSIIENYPPYNKGGAELTHNSFHKYMATKYDISLIVLTGHKNEKDLNKENFIILRELRETPDKNSSLLLSTLVQFHNVIIFLKNYLKYKPDLIELVPNNYDLLPLIILIRLLNKPLILALHNNLFLYQNKSILNWTNKLVEIIINLINKNKSFRIITISKFMSNSLVSKGVNVNKIDIINIPLEKLYEYKNTNNKIILASRLESEKGIEQILKAFSTLPKFELGIYGDGSLRKVVESYSKKYNNILYLGKKNENEILQEIIKSYAIIAHPIYDEPFGRYVIHSLSTLKPLISSKSGAVTEIIHDKINGLLVEKGDVQAIKRAVSLIFSDQKLYKQIVNNLKIERDKYKISLASSKRYKCYLKILNV